MKRHQRIAVIAIAAASLAAIAYWAVPPSIDGWWYARIDRPDRPDMHSTLRGFYLCSSNVFEFSPGASSWVGHYRRTGRTAYALDYAPPSPSTNDTLTVGWLSLTHSFGFLSPHTLRRSLSHSQQQRFWTQLFHNAHRLALDIEMGRPYEDIVADTEYKNCDLDRALEMAAYHQRTNLVPFLITTGANPHVVIEKLRKYAAETKSERYGDEATAAAALISDGLTSDAKMK